MSEDLLKNQVFVDSMAWFPAYFVVCLVGLLLFSSWILRDRDKHTSI